MEGLISKGAYNWNKKNVLKRASVDQRYMYVFHFWFLIKLKNIIDNKVNRNNNIYCTVILQ